MMQRFSAPFTIMEVSPSGPDKAKWVVRSGRSLVIFTFGLAIGCRPALPSAPTFPAADDGFGMSDIETPAGVSEDVPPPHAILPGDVLQLKVLSAEPYETTELWVDSAGCIHVPFGGDVVVMGLGLSQAEERVEQAIRKFDRFARVTLAIKSFSGHRIMVSGAVDKPGAYEARPGMRVAEVIAAAGGTRVLIGGNEMAEAADVDGARIVRDGKALPVSVKRAIFGEPLHNVYVRPGDIIFIPWMTSRHIPVLGDVRTARNVPFHPGLRLTEALAAAGGPSRTADNADIRIVRGPLSRAKVFRANLDDVIRGNTTDVVLAPGDVIFVTEHWFATASEVINRLTPLLASVAVGTSLVR